MSEQTQAVEDNAVKAPPSQKAMVGNDMIWLIAKLCHQLNRAFSAAVLSDHTHKTWEESTPEIRRSTYEGVRTFLEDPTLTPEQMHEKWKQYKLDEGWTYGNMRDEDARTHPNLVNYFRLHPHEQFKDVMFVVICRTLLGE